jgi:hypothetical protein
MVNPARPWPRPETPRAPLDVTSNETLELWAAQPEFDTRSLEEFAAEGGRPVGPPNRLETEPGFLHWLFHPEGGWLEFFRWLFRWPTRRDDRGRFYELPQGLELRPLAPAPPPPSTPMLTGYLRSSLPKAPIGGTGETRREDRRALRDELPPIYPDEDDGPIDAGGCLIFPFPKDVRPTLSMKPPAPNRSTIVGGPR